MNRQFSAQEMEQCGFISRILPEERFHEHVLKLATDAAKFSLEALKTTKKLVRDVDREMLMKVNEVEIDRLAERMVSPDCIAQMLAFVGKFTSFCNDSFRIRKTKHLIDRNRECPEKEATESAKIGQIVNYLLNTNAQ